MASSKLQNIAPGRRVFFNLEPPGLCLKCMMFADRKKRVILEDNTHEKDLSQTIILLKSRK